MFDLLSGASAIADLPNKGEGLTTVGKKKKYFYFNGKEKGRN